MLSSPQYPSGRVLFSNGVCPSRLRGQRHNTHTKKCWDGKTTTNVRRQTFSHKRVNRNKKAIENEKVQTKESDLSHNCQSVMPFPLSSCHCLYPSRPSWRSVTNDRWREREKQSSTAHRRLWGREIVIEKSLFESQRERAFVPGDPLFSPPNFQTPDCWMPGGERRTNSRRQTIRIQQHTQQSRETAFLSRGIHLLPYCYGLVFRLVCSA